MAKGGRRVAMESLFARGEKAECNERSELHQVLKEPRGAMRCAYCTLRS